MPTDIDFGFMLGISPGGVGFEAAPFKMPQEYIDILGGIDSPKFEEFRKLMRSGFKEVRKEAERVIMMDECRKPIVQPKVVKLTPLIFLLQNRSFPVSLPQKRPKTCGTASSLG